MAVVYATLIVKGKKTFADVPARIQDQVKQKLIKCKIKTLICGLYKPCIGVFLRPYRKG